MGRSILAYHRFNEAAAISPRNVCRSSSPPASPTRFNEAAATSPRKPGGEILAPRQILRLTEAAATSPRKARRLQRDEGDDRFASMRSRLLDRGKLIKMWIQWLVNYFASMRSRLLHRGKVA